MKSMCREIKTIVESAAPTIVSEIKSSYFFTVSAPQQFVPLQKIQLPLFDRSLLEWRSFCDIYAYFMHDNTGVGDAERFHYLLSCLLSDDLTIVKSIPLSANNYVIVWDVLSDRFDNKHLLASEHLNKIFEFEPIVQQSLQALRAFVNTFKKNVAIIKALGVNDFASFLLFHMGSGS